MTTWRARVVETPLLTALVFDAALWNRCAVGEQAAAHPLVVRMTGWCGRPDDDQLYRLGTEFSRAIEADDRALALEILDQIEDRVLTLKRAG